MISLCVSLLPTLLSLLLLFPAKPSPKWSYHLPQGKSYAYHFSYKSEAKAGTPNSGMEQTFDADVVVTVTRIEKQGNFVLALKASNILSTFKKQGDWSPAHVILVPECEITVDPTGAMISGKIIRDDTSYDASVQKLNQEQILERTLRQTLYRFPQRESFYDGYSWHDTIPVQGRPVSAAKNSRPGAPQTQQMQTIANYVVSAGTDADPKIIWSLNYDMARNGKPDGKDFSETTKGYYSFEEATGMIAGYEATTETHRGSDVYKTTKSLKLRY